MSLKTQTSSHSQTPWALAHISSPVLSRRSVITSCRTSNSHTIDAVAAFRHFVHHHLCVPCNCVFFFPIFDSKIITRFLNFCFNSRTFSGTGSENLRPPSEPGLIHTCPSTKQWQKSKYLAVFLSLVFQFLFSAQLLLKCFLPLNYLSFNNNYNLFLNWFM